MVVSKRIYVRGIVQGVGFRPFVYNLAKELRLSGWVLNDSFGVTIEIEGPSKRVKRFLAVLSDNPPVLAQITDIRIEDLPEFGAKDFVIKESRERREKFTLISPDISICDECLQELFDKNDRRYRYPFINCTNCGPRYTIIKDIPYDRPKTTMAEFRMCSRCEQEYRNPANRRFHAQPNACPVCGPHVWLVDSEGKNCPGDPVKETIRFLKQGKIVAIKGLGGFHLAVDALNDRAVRELRRRKNRYEKPFALMSPDLQKVEKFARIEPIERKILESPQRPVCLLKKLPDNEIATSVSPDNEYLGTMLPYTPLHYLILTEGDFTALVMTSGNMSDEPIVHTNREALHRLGRVADYFLLHNREIYQRVDDSVVRMMSGDLSFIRRSRGFAPLPVMINRNLPPVLAVGGELKNTFCLNKSRYFFLSQHIGDLENVETLEFFEEGVQHLRKILEIQPQLIAYDLHPDYLSTKWALGQQELPAMGVQHHHAHVASCMAEKGLTGKVIGFSLDGTGYGTDGTIWGGEVLIADELGFERAAHLRQVKMPGVEKAIREPWRMALAYALEAGLELDVGKYFTDVSGTEADLVKQMLRKNLNSPVTSSCGRLFDAVAALAGLRHRVGYEGQAAMQLEAHAVCFASVKGTGYRFEIEVEENKLVLDWRPVIRQVLKDAAQNYPAGMIGIKFHRGIVRAFARIADLLRERFALDRVVLSGGCFQNRYLTENLSRRLTKRGFRVYYQTLVPPNDGGLALGQAYIAAHVLQKSKGAL